MGDLSISSKFTGKTVKIPKHVSYGEEITIIQKVGEEIYQHEFIFTKEF